MIQKTTLPNGVRILTEVVDEVYSASIGVYVDVGSEDESEHNNGVSHCLEHMLFKGTSKRTAQDISQEIEDVGGSLGAATGKENTCFYGRVMGDQLHVAIDLLLDMIVDANLDKDDLELERQVILEEIKMYDDDPEDYAHETLINNIWPGHPLGLPITGTFETVSGFDAAMVRNHVEKFYRPERLVISIAGKFDEKRAIDQIANALKDMKPGTAQKNNSAPKMHKYRAVKHRDIEQAHISIVSNGLKITDELRYVFAILDLCLGGNMSSRLFQEVREKRGLVYTINSFRESHRENGLFGVYAGCSPKQITKVLKLVSEEFKRMKSEGFTEQEINRGKIQLRSELLLGLESMRNRTARSAYGELFYGRQLSVDEIVHDIDLVTGEQVKNLANQLIQQDLLSMIVVGPESELKPSYELAC
ncbi:MAG TPA: pitrilysin family protein [Drouetiella sp.]